MIKSNEIDSNDQNGGGITNLVDAEDWPIGLTPIELGYVNGVTSEIQPQLDGKAASSHTHPQADITNLVSDLAGKAAASHTHAASDITSGTLDAARLPGVLANVDTQAELQTAVGNVEATIDAMASATTETKTVDTTSGGVSLKTSGAGLRGFLATNNGATDCYLSFSGTAVSGATAVSNGGHLLPANGGEIYLDSPGALAIKAITAAGSTVVAVSLFD